MSSNKKIHIIGGGTVVHSYPHLSLSSVAYGSTAKKMAAMFRAADSKMDVVTHLTKMADSSSQIETPDDVQNLINDLISQESTKIIIFNPAIVDFEMLVDPFPPSIHENETPKNIEPGKYGDRLNSSLIYNATLIPPRKDGNRKIIDRIRRKRKDIFLVGFKTTSQASSQEQYIAGLNLLKRASCNLVLANDTGTRNNMIITPEEARYHETSDRDDVLRNLVEMTLLRSHLTFTRSTVVLGESVPWTSPEIPDVLRTVVDYCVERGAYKKFRGATVGHFAYKLSDTEFLTSKRKTNFNDLNDVGLVRIKTDGPDSVIAYGSKPSVGGQSQRIVFKEHVGMDCIVHFHCPIKPGSSVPVRSQREYECGSHECGQNTSSGLAQFGNLKAVYLSDHGPNIVFSKDIDPAEVVQFIEHNFDLESKTGGPVY